jgi:pimeloyl-ACP methyl ester carboxylesterase
VWENRDAKQGRKIALNLVVQQKRACADWRRASVPPDAHAPVRSTVPVLLISGERDPVTPPEFGARVARSLPNSLHLILPHGGHGVVGNGPCIDDIVRDFLDRAGEASVRSTAHSV